MLEEHKKKEDDVVSDGDICTAVLPPPPFILWALPVVLSLGVPSQIVVLPLFLVRSCSLGVVGRIWNLNQRTLRFGKPEFEIAPPVSGGHSIGQVCVSMDRTVEGGLTAEPCETAIKGWAVSLFCGVYSVPLGRLQQYLLDNALWHGCFEDET